MRGDFRDKRFTNDCWIEINNFFYHFPRAREKQRARKKRERKRKFHIGIFLVNKNPLLLLLISPLLEIKTFPLSRRIPRKVEKSSFCSTLSTFLSGQWVCWNLAFLERRELRLLHKYVFAMCARTSSLYLASSVCTPALFGSSKQRREREREREKKSHLFLLPPFPRRFVAPRETFKPSLRFDLPAKKARRTQRRTLEIATSTPTICYIGIVQPLIFPHCVFARA